MDKELLNKYQEAIGLLQYRNPGCSFSGSFQHLDSDDVAFELYVARLRDGFDWQSGKKLFKPMKDETMALKYFIKSAQNLVLKNMFNN
jgi:hypothetical protein